LNSGRIIFVIIVPNISNNPKYIDKSKKRHAKRKTANKTYNKSCKIIPPVSSLYTATGPSSNKTMIAKIAAKTLVIVQNMLTWNRLWKKGVPDNHVVPLTLA